MIAIGDQRRKTRLAPRRTMETAAKIGCGESFSPSSNRIVLKPSAGCGPNLERCFGRAWRERLKLRDLKSGRDVAYSQDDLLKVERDVADSVVAGTGLPVFVAWNLSREQVGPSAGKIADVKPPRGKKVGRAKKGS